MQPSTSFIRIQNQTVMRLVAVAALAVAGVLLVTYLLLALHWYDEPFVGFLPTRSLEVSDSQSLSGDDWLGYTVGLRPGDQIDRVAGVDLGSVPVGKRIEVLDDTLEQHQVGSRIGISFLRDFEEHPDKPIGAQCTALADGSGLSRCGMQIWLRRLPTGDLIAYFGIGWALAAFLWISAAYLMVRHGNNAHVRYVVMLSAALSVFLGGYFDTLSTHRFVWAWLTATALSAGLMAVLGLEFPYKFAFVQQMPVWDWAPVLIGLALGGASTALYQSTDPNLSDAALAIPLGTMIVGAVFMAGMMLWRRTRSASPIVRNQSTMLLMGLVPALAPVALWFAALVVQGRDYSELVMFHQSLPMLLPLTAMYAALRYGVIDTDRMITYSFLYGGLLVISTVAYWLLVAGIAMLIGQSAADLALEPVPVVIAIFGVAVLFSPLRTLLGRVIDAVYFRARRQYQIVLEQFSRDVTQMVALNDVIQLVQRTLEDTLAPSHVILYVRDLTRQEYLPHTDPTRGVRPTDVTFPGESGLIRHLHSRASLLHLEEGRPLPLDVVSDRARLAVLGTPILIGLRGQRVLNGLLAIGPRKSGAPYLHEDLRFIESLSDQIALAVERAQAVEDLERRVEVQDVLSQVSRALNFAIDFDTLLELIYAQTLRVIHAPCFYIALRDANTEEMSYVFYNEGEDRMPHMEGKRWRMGRDLISEIARSQQTLRTDDYVRESLARDPHTMPENPNLKAWMGVPLLADTGGGVLGVMVASTTNAGITFSDDQQDLFWDIANLAASAIDKLQLFEKTQQRARQLAAINQISNQLASEMGNVSRLLHLITDSAVQILNAEAGSLLLVDEDSGDLEFRVAVGGSGEELVGKRIPAGSGLAGATVQRETAIIVNDPTRDSRWYGDVRSTTEQQVTPGDGRDVLVGERDASIGFKSSAILSVPLMVGGRATGVLQVINKVDGSIFIPEDADLLQTFAGQAAIAIENARLFDMTDQQLALRVQELDTMQRIDQELNRTLNLRNVVDITMDWAMRKSGAVTGALFIRGRERGDLRIVASYGYPAGTPFYPDGDRVFPDNEGVIGRVVRTGQPSLITNVEQDPDYEETLPGCVAQLTVPLFSANRVIGVIILESDHPGELDLLDLDFVARLAEHASPAIVNSQLFQELERANESKSEFVSFVAHELKNPMTSIKGFTDLLIKGVVGPVNEQQSNFLHTVFSNVTRMETLVSDLNDLTKQQTNRLRLDIMTVDFRNVVLETLRSQQRQITDRNQELVVEIPESLPQVRGDHNRLIQIMTNFISNANKYTPPGGRVRVQAEVTRNHWDPQGPPEVIHCLVQDTGIGMSKEDMDQLFTPYFRSENPKTREQPGTGLGLSITKGLIEQHGGRIWVESEVEAGTIFHFTIPVATEAATARARV